jgi:S1-C subfamily serine protease
MAAGTRRSVRNVCPTSSGATAMAAALTRVLGFMYYIDTPGIVVDSVVAGSQAANAGLRRNDVLTGVNDTLRIGNSWDWGMFKSAQPVGEPFVLNVLREGRPLRLRAALAMQSSAPGTE